MGTGKNGKGIREVQVEVHGVQARQLMRSYHDLQD